MILLTLTLLACSGSDTTTEPGDFPGCDAYLACVGAAMPDQLDVAEASYGSEGACWGQGDDYDALCEEACETSLLAASHLYKDVDACEPIGGWVPEDGCPFLNGSYGITLIDGGGDCFPPGFLDQAFDAGLTCTDDTWGEFDFLIEDMFTEALACVTGGYVFTCDDPSLEFGGSFHHSETSASGTMVIVGADCDAGATWEMVL